MYRICRIAIGLLGIAIAGTAFSKARPAESNYTRLDRAERSACTKASGFVRATVSPRLVRFSDEVGYDIRLVSGTYPQKHLKGAAGKMLCAYKRGSGKVEVQEFKGW